ncbi:ComF family protein [Paenibacillus senegalensis]|uniref:ComF family protein n=1 Tax=Paenibacillus senegalensis TaxID=1465766 RepID=UPI000287A57D|nr:ComF family protein [Paenibacillus senegalensis]
MGNQAALLLSNLWKRIRRLGNIADSWLSPVKQSCLFCGSPYKPGHYVLELCPACFRSIPWITRVECATCGRAEACGDCARRQAKETYFIKSRSAVRYDAFMKEMLSQYKYRGRERLLPLFAVMMVHAFQLLQQAESLKEDDFHCITYVPVHRTRLMERGFDQAEQMAKALAERLHIPVQSLIVRTRDTPKQSFKSRQERIMDLQDAFALQPNATISVGRPNILLIDDVFTTGSTMNHCSKLLSTHYNVRVYGLTWAR